MSIKLFFVATICLKIAVTLTSAIFLNTTKQSNGNKLIPVEMTEPDGDSLWSTLLEEWTLRYVDLDVVVLSVACNANNTK